VRREGVAVVKSQRKVRVKIDLEPKQNSSLTYLAKVSGKSKSALIRSCIDQFIDKTPSRAEALKLLESIVPDVPPLEEDKMPAAKG
jgi:predicted DNA-binding protein